MAGSVFIARIRSPQGFQSSPGHATGRDDISLADQPGPHRFNPHPATRPGATAGGLGVVCVTPVSILTRPRDRARLDTGRFSAPRLTFQSSPGHATGRDQVRQVTSAMSSSFQSSPGHATGRDAAHGGGAHPVSGCFNPHPATRPGATRTRPAGPSSCEVSILTRPRDRARPPHDLALRVTP